LLTAEAQRLSVPSPTTLIDSERALILRTLEAAGWVIGGRDGAATRLGLKRTTLIYKMQRHGISRPSLDSNTGMSEAPAHTAAIANMDIEVNAEAPGRYSDQPGSMPSRN
jgi:hypothetical protein